MDVKGDLVSAATQNAKLDGKLREARDRILALRAEVDRLSRPPNSYGIVLKRNDDGTVDVHSGGRKMRVATSSDVEGPGIGEEVALNESLTVVSARRPDRIGEVATVKELLDDGSRAVVTSQANEERVVELRPGLAADAVRIGDSVMLDPAAALAIERLPRPQVADLILEEVPDVSYDDVGGLDAQIEKITDAIELPFVHQSLFLRVRPPSPQRSAALRAARLRQDAHRQGRGQQPHHEGRRALGRLRGPQLLPERQRARAA